MGIERERAGNTAAEGLAHDKIQCADVGQLVTYDVALDNPCKQRLDALSRHLLPQQRVVRLVIGDDRNVGRVAFVPGP